MLALAAAITVTDLQDAGSAGAVGATVKGGAGADSSPLAQLVPVVVLQPSPTVHSLSPLLARWTH